VELREKLSAAVLSFNTASKLESCLRSLETFLPGSPVVVWDNASRDDSREMVRARFPEVELVASPENLLFAEGCNRSIERCRTELVVIMNADVRLEDDAFADIVELMEASPELVAVSPSVEDDGRLRHMAHEVVTPSLAIARDSVLGMILRRTRWYRRAMLEDVPPDAVFRAPKITNCCCVVRRDAFLAMGGFDRRQLLYWSEEVFAIRAAEKGYEQAVYGTCRVSHEHGSSTGTLPSSLLRAIVVRDRLAYMSRHFGMAAALLVELAVFPRLKLWRSASDWWNFFRHRREMNDMARIAGRAPRTRAHLSPESS